MLSKTIEIVKPDNKYVNFIIEGINYPTIKPLDTFTGEYMLVVKSNITTMNDCMRYFGLKNILFGVNDDTTFYDMNGLLISQAQYVNIENVTVKNFKKQSVIIKDVYDSTINNLKILNCGDVENLLENNTFYALELQSSLDNVNACHFNSLHIERCPLLLKIGARCRHNQFISSKFEQTVKNNTTNAVIAIEGESGENTFTDCQFVKNAVDDEAKYFIYGRGNKSYHVSSKFFCKIEGGMFTCAVEPEKNLLLNIDGFIINNCQFNNVAGTNSMFPFEFNSENIFTNNKIICKSKNSNLISIAGNSNIIKSNIFEYIDEEPSSGVFLHMQDGVKGNIFNDNDILGKYYQPYSKSNPYLEENIFNNNYPFKKIKVDSSSGTLPAMLMGSNVIVLANTSQLTEYSNFRFAYNGQKIILINKGNQVSILHNPSKIVLKEQSNKTLNNGDSLELLNIDNVWYEI